METASWVLVGLVGLLGFVIDSRLRSIEGRLNGLYGLLSTDGPDPGFTSYQRLSAGYLSAIKAMLEQETGKK